MEGATNCPTCNIQMEMHGDVMGGHLHHCNTCLGMLITDRWLVTKMESQVIKRIKNGIFNGVNAGYKCPTCGGEMAKGQVSTLNSSIELEGCIKCSSIWFDNREIEPFLPEHEEHTPQPSESITSRLSTGITDFLKKLNQSK